MTSFRVHDRSFTVPSLVPLSPSPVILSADVMGRWLATVHENGPLGCKSFVSNVGFAHFHGSEGFWFFGRGRTKATCFAALSMTESINLTHYREGLSITVRALFQ